MSLIAWDRHEPVVFFSHVSNILFWVQVSISNPWLNSILFFLALHLQTKTPGSVSYNNHSIADTYTVIYADFGPTCMGVSFLTITACILALLIWLTCGLPLRLHQIELPLIFLFDLHGHLISQAVLHSLYCHSSSFFDKHGWCSFSCPRLHFHSSCSLD